MLGVAVRTLVGLGSPVGEREAGGGEHEKRREERDRYACPSPLPHYQDPPLAVVLTPR